MSYPTNDNAQELIQQRTDSRNWMRDSYWPQWEEVYQNYKCIVDVRKDADGNDDEDKTHIGMPDTFALVNRRTDRITAQIPQIGFIAENRNEEVETAVSRKAMSDWDNGGLQRQQKRHVRQAELLGWSVRSWWWEVAEFERRRGIDIAKTPLDQKDIELIAKTYKADPQILMTQPAALARLMETNGKRGLLDIRYKYKAYEGPRSEVLFSGDCFPEPFFDSIQTSNRFIVELRRGREWFMKLGKRYEEFQAGIKEMFQQHPKGTDPKAIGTGDDGRSLKDQMRGIVSMPTTQDNRYNQGNSGTQMWTVLARWTPGVDAKVAYVAEDGIWLGEILSPYTLDGKIPFTELILIDDILGGVGDSVARITRGLQTMHNVATNRRFDLYRQISQPLYGTTDRAIYDNPEVLRRDLMRLVHMRQGPNSLWSVNEGAAMAAMAQSMNTEADVARMFQMASGDSNMSMSANVDPSQLRTATGAKIMQGNQDVLTKGLVDMFHMTSVHADVEMIYLFNRSEMADAVSIDGKYDRNYDPNVDRDKLPWIKAEAIHFQVDGHLTVELGSTLADDDEAKVAKATNLFAMLANNPLANPETLVRDLLIAHGKGPKLAEYMQQQPPAAPPPIKANMSVSVDMEKLPEATQRVILQNAGVDQQSVQQMQQEVEAEAAGQAAGGQVPPGPPGAPPEIDPAQILQQSTGGGMPS